MLTSTPTQKLILKSGSRISISCKLDPARIAFRPSLTRSLPSVTRAGIERFCRSEIRWHGIRANKIFTPQPPLRSSPSYRERCIPIRYLLSPRIRCRCRLRDLFATVSHRRRRPRIVARGRDYRVRDPCTNLSSAFLSSKDYLNLSRVVKDFRLFPREIICQMNALFRKCYDMLRDSNFLLTQNMYLQIIIAINKYIILNIDMHVRYFTN